MITEALTRPLGPLAAWQWALVLAGGYIGYRYITGQGIGGGGHGSATTTSGNTGSNIIQGPQGEAGPAGASFGITASDITDWLNAGASADDIKKIIDEITGKVTPPPTTPPGPTGNPPPPKPGPTKITYGPIWGSDVPDAIKNIDPTGSGVAALFKKLKLGYGTVVNMKDLVAAFQKARLGFGTVVEAKDLQNLFNKEGIKNTPAVLPTTTTLTGSSKISGATAKPPTGAIVAPSTSAPKPTASIASLAPTPATAFIGPVSTTIGNQTSGQKTSSPTRVL